MTKTNKVVDADSDSELTRIMESHGVYDGKDTLYFQPEVDSFRAAIIAWAQSRPNSWYQEQLQASIVKYQEACDRMNAAAKKMGNAAKDLEEATKACIGRPKQLEAKVAKNTSELATAFEDILVERDTRVSKKARLEGKLEAARYFKNYMISNSPFIDQIIEPYIATLTSNKETK